jgi:hypothetical protein
MLVSLLRTLDTGLGLCILSGKHLELSFSFYLQISNYSALITCTIKGVNIQLIENTDNPSFEHDLRESENCTTYGKPLKMCSPSRRYMSRA